MDKKIPNTSNSVNINPPKKFYSNNQLKTIKLDLNNKFNAIGNPSKAMPNKEKKNVFVDKAKGKEVNFKDITTSPFLLKVKFIDFL